MRGAEAYDFLRRQLTQNPPDDAAHFTLAAWNDAKGRVRGLFRIVRTTEGPLLIAERDGLDALLAKLRLFVLRSDVTLTHADSHGVAAVIGNPDALLAERGIALDAVGAAADASGLTWLRLGPALVHVAGPSSELERLGRGLGLAEPAQAALAEIRLGLPYIGTALVERYVPQMLNLDRLGAIAFDKGCYPGQEVVARLHHRGAVKRRLTRLVGDGEQRGADAGRDPDVEPGAPGLTVEPHAPGLAVEPGTPSLDGHPGTPPIFDVAPGTPIFDASGAEIGEVVRAAAAGAALELLAVVQIDAGTNEAYVEIPDLGRFRLTAMPDRR